MENKLTKDGGRINMKIYVKTIYGQEYDREPNISSYNTVEEANQFIKTCQKWGIGIISCNIIPTEYEFTERIKSYLGFSSCLLSRSPMVDME